MLSSGNIYYSDGFYQGPLINDYPHKYSLPHGQGVYFYKDGRQKKVHYCYGRQDGAPRRLAGKIGVLICGVNCEVSDDFRAALVSAEDSIIQQAAKHGQQVRFIHEELDKVTISDPCNDNAAMLELLKRTHYNYSNMRFLFAKNGEYPEHIITVFAINAKGTSHARTNACEDQANTSIFRDQSGRYSARVFIHEICHLFGAVDYYEQAAGVKVAECAKRLCPKSVMLCGADATVIDEYTASLIWEIDLDLIPGGKKLKELKELIEKEK